jgi:hypothetical protein
MLRPTAFWVTVALITMFALRYVPGLWPLCLYLIIYLLVVAPAWRLERDMRRELKAVIRGRG